MEYTDLRLRLRPQREGSHKITYRVQGIAKGEKSWRLTPFSLEWFPRLKAWKIIESRPASIGRGPTYWKQATLADFGNVSEEEACLQAITTLRLLLS